MGASYSNRNNNSVYSVTVNDFVLRKISDGDGNDDGNVDGNDDGNVNGNGDGNDNGNGNEDKKCSTPENCELEDIEIKALAKMTEMDNEITEKHQLTSEAFHLAYDNNIEKVSEVVQNLEFQTFKEHREKVAEAFSGDSLVQRQEAYLEYKDAIEKELDKISKQNAELYTPPENINDEPPPPDSPPQSDSDVENPKENGNSEKPSQPDSNIEKPKENGNSEKPPEADPNVQV